MNIERNRQRRILETVKAGIKILDDKYKKRKVKWFDRINLDTLDISSCYRCVLGQLYTHYAEGLEELEISSRESSFDLGFNTPSYDLNKSKEERRLTATWKRQIIKRRKDNG